ncbi:hypothetical protein ACI6Q2_07435 [Chitinophagaceae bacterium LWZ2-11]
MLSNINNNIIITNPNIDQGQLLKELNIKGKFYADIVHWTTLFLLPVFLLFDYLFLPDSWVDMLLVRVIVAVLTYVVYMVGRKQKWRYYKTVSVFISINVVVNATICVVVDVNNMLPYFLLMSIIFLLFNTTIFWKPYFSFLQCGLALFVSAVLFRVFHKYASYEDLVNHGGGIFFVLSILSCFLANNRYQLILRDIINTMTVNQAVKKANN